VGWLGMRLEMWLGCGHLEVVEVVEVVRVRVGIGAGNVIDLHDAIWYGALVYVIVLLQARRRARFKGRPRFSHSHVSQTYQSRCF
jgi:hypothetical protein